jgi:hypothetical protein
LAIVAMFFFMLVWKAIFNKIGMMFDAIRQSKDKVDLFLQRGKNSSSSNTIAAFMEDCIEEVTPLITENFISSKKCGY